MLKVPAPFPEVGSFALLVDTNLPRSQQRAELVRVMRRIPEHSQAAVSFPLRSGAFGNRVVGDQELIDATPLSDAELAELEQLRSYCASRVRPNIEKVLRSEKLRTRHVWAGVMRFELRKLERLEAKTQPSTGSIPPDDADDSLSAGQAQRRYA